MIVHKKIQPNRSSRLAGYTQHIYIYEYLVLLYRLAGDVPDVAQVYNLIHKTFP